MDVRAKKACPYPTCSNLQPCPTHGKPGWSRHPSPRRRNRKESGWALQKRAARVIARDEGICYICGEPGAEEADHVDRGGPDREDNMKAICGPCHKAKTQREAARARQAVRL
jgi:5-methylcytosine-specific restriction protein A